MNETTNWIMIAVGVAIVAVALRNNSELINSMLNQASSVLDSVWATVGSVIHG